MFDIFIKRPVLSLVISLIIVLLGVLSYFELSVSQYPDIIPPSVSVRARYTGGNADVATRTVAVPLERAINGVPGMTHMSSVASNNGTVVIDVTFAVGTDPDLAAVAVQNRVQTIIDELPEEVIRNGVIVEKEVNSLLMYVNIVSTDPNLDEKFIYNFTDINILQELKRIDGVGYSEIVSEKDYSMRVWLKPDRMTSYKISTEEIVEAIQRQNIEAAPGKAGESSDKTPQALQYVLRYTGKFSTPEEYENLVLRSDADGSILRLKDVADIEFGAQSFARISKNNGTPAASILINQRPGSNARDVITRIKARMTELEDIFPPGMTYNYTYDVSRFLDASISEVVRTLIEAFLLVSLVVFIFLQDWRSTLIPALAIPVALIGALFFMQVMGFSINLLTLFALVLAIGIVVDNAIVVVEAVHAKMETENLPPREATFAAMKEISSAIIAITLVMSAVFVPVAFLSGPVGVFYRQFSLTLAIAIVISGINALTLTPALCAIMLKNPHHSKKKTGILQRFFNGFNRWYSGLENGYRRVIAVIAGRRTVTIGLLALFLVATYGINSVLPTGFIPNEDQGVVYINVTAPSGATLERTEKVLDEIQYVLNGMDIVEATSTLAGYSLVNGVSGASFGMGIINLVPWDQRQESVDDVIEILHQRTRHITDARVEFFSPPTVPGFGNASGFEMRLLDQTGTGDLQAFEKVTHDFIAALEAGPIVDKAHTNFDPNFPQYLIHVDHDMAAKKGVTVEDAMSTLQVLMGGYYASNFVRFGQMYRVMVQALPEYREKPEDLLSLFVRNKDGEMVPYSTFIRLERVYGPEQLTRYNMYNAARVNGNVKPGYSTGDAIAEIRRLAAETLPRGYSFDWAGMTREEVKSGDQAIYIFLISLIFVYLLLAAQYESFLLPLPVLLSLPAGIFGAFFALKVLGLENNIYAQVALIMLIGLLGKNAILIVEFAIQRKAEGVSVLKAAVEGSVARLRPILMTSFAFVAGLIPLVVATGAGAMGNRSIGTAAAGGMVIGTVFGVIVIPGLYVLFASLTERKKPEAKKAQPTNVDVNAETHPANA